MFVPMKTLFRTFLVLFILLLTVAGVGYFVLTRPAFQKKMIEAWLPEGSSIDFVQITSGSIELQDLKLRLPDGTSAKLDSIRSDFSLMAAVFENTIQLSGLKLDGLLIKLPEAVAPTEATTQAGMATSQVSPPTEAPQSLAEAPVSPIDALYSLGEIAWLLDLDSIGLNGALIDALGNRYAFGLSSSRIAPGVETTLNANLKSESKEALQGGLKDFNSDVRLVFTQKKSGGFEKLYLESHSEGSDVSGGKLLSISQSLELSINSFERTAEVDLGFEADLPHPEVFAPELIALQGLSLQGALKAVAEGEAFILQAAKLDASAKGLPVAALGLKQSLALGAGQTFSGELMEVALFNLPLAWFSPSLGDDLQLSGVPLSATIIVSGEPSGALQVGSLEPVQVGPFSVTQDQQLLLQEVTLRMHPMIRVEADQSIRFDLGDFELLDRYGAFISGTASGSRKEAPGDSPLSGLRAQATFDLGLTELLQQPVLKGSASVLAGQAKLALEIDGGAEYPAQLQASITGLRARDLPGSRQDYRLAMQLKQTGAGGYALGSSFAAGSENRPSTSMQLAGELNPDIRPMPFKIHLTAASVLQRDMDLLVAAAKPQEPAADLASPATASSPGGLVSEVSPVATTPVAARPPWADLKGEFKVQVDELTMASGQVIKGLNALADISETLLAVREIAASLEDGRLGGNAQVVFDPTLAEAYQVSSALSFKNVDPSIFSKKASGSFPVKGLFDGDFNFVGRGATLEAALDDSEGDLLITGRDGVLTAFELDNRSQLGLLGAGILGQSLNRPGITALAQAVPYFKDIRFDSFTLKLARGMDKKVRIPELSLLGENLRIKGQGFIAASSLGEVLDQPLDLTLGLGAKGRLIDYLEALGLLKPATAEDSFRGWNKDIKIGGTLGDPDTSALMDILNDAARRALADPKKTTPPAQTTPPAEGGLLVPASETTTPPPAEEPRKKTKEEKLKDDIEMGVDLLNSLFG